MKKSSLAILLLLLSYSINIVGQNNNKTVFKAGVITLKNDPLINHIEIISTNENFISINVPSGLNFLSNNELRTLISRFQSSLQKLESKLPEYEFYSIEYVDDVLLEISEVIGKEVYQLSNDSINNSIKHSNTCTIHRGYNKIVILFSDIEELLDAQLTKDINEGLTFLLDKRSQIRRGYIPILQTYSYDAKNKSSNAIKDDFLEIGLLSGLEFNGTYLQNRFFYKFKFSLHFNTNILPRLYFGVAATPLYSFSTQTQEQITTIFIGPALGIKGVKIPYSQIEFLWKTMDNNDVLKDTNYKLGISTRRNNINFGFDWYDIASSDQIFALSLGFSF